MFKVFFRMILPSHLVLHFFSTIIALKLILLLILDSFRRFIMLYGLNTCVVTYSDIATIGVSLAILHSP